ncbi:hypothetical protein PtB15_3B251 [Puccinia triticina]|nr:hypothetical protein PtB15_3B251 [Puccinia triticina]
MTREAEEVDADSYRHWLRKRSELLESAATASDKGQRLAATDADALRGLQGPNQFSGQISVAVGKEEGRIESFSNTGNENSMYQNAKATHEASGETRSIAKPNSFLNSGQAPDAKSIKDQKNIFQRFWEKIRNAWSRLWEFVLRKDRKPPTSSGNKGLKQTTPTSSDSPIKTPTDINPTQDDYQKKTHEGLMTAKKEGVETTRFTQPAKENKVFSTKQNEILPEVVTPDKSNSEDINPKKFNSNNMTPVKSKSQGTNPEEHKQKGIAQEKSKPKDMTAQEFQPTEQNSVMKKYNDGGGVFEDERLNSE